MRMVNVEYGQCRIWSMCWSVYSVVSVDSSQCRLWSVLSVVSIESGQCSVVNLKGGQFRE